MRAIITAAVLALGSVALVTSASAQHWGGHGGHWGGGHPGFGHPGFGHPGFVGHGFRGGGHFWHGRFWGYGIGPCWRRTPVGWVWICD